MKALRIILWLLVAAAVAGVGAFTLRQRSGTPQTLPTQVSFGGPFTLVDSTGRTFASSKLAGRPYAIFFGFTHCPDVCPTTLVEMGNHLSALGPDADRLRIVFVTVDAVRDTSEHLRTYLASLDARIIGPPRSEAQIAEAAKGWNAHYNKFTESDGSITIVHSAHVYLMDADNRLAATLNFHEPEDE